MALGPPRLLSEPRRGHRLPAHRGEPGAEAHGWLLFLPYIPALIDKPIDRLSRRDELMSSGVTKV